MTVWVYQGNLSSAIDDITYGAAARDGTVVVWRGGASTNLGNAYRSTDGFATWNTQTTPAHNGIFSSGSVGAILSSDAGQFNITGYPGLAQWYSGDDGVDWIRSSAGFHSHQSVGGITDGAGTGIFFSDATAEQSFTLDGGATWATVSTPFPGAGGSQRSLWDGTQFVTFVQGSNLQIWTAPSGFGGGGPVWTKVFDAPAAAGIIPQATLAYSQCAYDPSFGYTMTVPGTGTGGGIIVSATLAGLYSATMIVPPGWSFHANPVGVWAAAGFLFLCDTSGLLFVSQDGGTTWTTEATNFAVSGEFIGTIVYDSVHAAFIAVGESGSVSTFSAGSAVPDVTGETVAAASTEITTAGFVVGTITQVTSMAVDVGLIISQVPAGGTIEPGGSSVNLTESTGPTVPDLTGLTYTAAQAALTAAGLTVGLVTNALNPAPAGQVFSQSPAPGSTNLHLGASINFSISLGSVSDTVPNIVGLSASNAAIALLSAGLDLGNVVFVNTDAQDPGDVVTQSIPAGTLVAPGTMIDVTIAALVKPFDVDATVISQYANSPTIIRLVENMAEYLDPRTNFEQFYNFVWNVDTAKGFGLDIWGRIVGVSRLLQLGSSGQPFGFENADVPFDWQNFGGGTFFTGGAGSSVILADDPYRVLILTKALANITATTSQALNKLLRNLFPGRGVCFVRDNLDMTMTYVFKFTLTPIEFAILTQSGVMPHPAGVGFNVVIIPPAVFGFSEAGFGVYLPFNFGIFYLPP